jgi:hypothetical protein
MGRLQPPTSYAVDRTIGSRRCGNGWNAAHEAEGKPYTLTSRICVEIEAAQECAWTPPTMQKRSSEENDSGVRLRLAIASVWVRCSAHSDPGETCLLAAVGGDRLKSTRAIRSARGATQPLGILVHDHVMDLSGWRCGEIRTFGCECIPQTRSYERPRKSRSACETTRIGAVTRHEVLLRN